MLSLTEGGPTDAASAMGILSTIAGNVKIEVKLDANVMFGQIRDLLQNPPGPAYAVVFNASPKTVRFEGCPASSVGSVLGCNLHTTAPKAPNFITKPHGMV